MSTDDQTIDDVDVDNTADAGTGSGAGGSNRWH
jgi:hypothetical protein